MQEYLFGRLWFSPEDGKCKAFCFYTYGSPDFFAQMRVADVAVCPLLSTLESSAGISACRSVMDYLKVMDGLDKEEMLHVYSSLTQPLQKTILKSAMFSATPPSVLEKLMSGVVQVDEALFRTLMCTCGASAEAVLLVLQHTRNEVVAAAGKEEVGRFEMLQASLASGIPLDQTMSNEIFTWQNILGSHLANAAVVTALVARGFPVSSILGGECYEWFRTPLASAALEGYTNSVRVLLDAGASVDETVGDDEWNAIVYACFGGCAEVIELLRERFADHPVWHSTTLPLEIKQSPMSLLPPPETVELSQPDVGSVEDLMKKQEQKKKQSNSGAFSFQPLA